MVEFSLRRDSIVPVEEVKSSALEGPKRVSLFLRRR